MKIFVALLLMLPLTSLYASDVTRSLYQIIIDNGQTAGDSEEKTAYKRPFFRYVYDELPRSSRKDSVYIFSTYKASNIFFGKPAELRKRADLLDTIDNLDHVSKSGDNYENQLSSDLVKSLARVKSNEGVFSTIKENSVVYIFSPFLHSAGIRGNTTSKAVLKRTIELFDASMPTLDPEISPKRKTVMFWVNGDIAPYVKELWKKNGYGELELYTDVQSKSILQRYKR